LATLCIKITFVSSSYSILSAAQFLKIRGLIRQVDPEDNGNGLTFTNWYTHAAQPDGAGDCVIMDTRTGFFNILGAWWDDPCSGLRPSICEL